MSNIESILEPQISRISESSVIQSLIAKNVNVLGSTLDDIHIIDMWPSKGFSVVGEFQDTTGRYTARVEGKWPNGTRRFILRCLGREAMINITSSVIKLTETDTYSENTERG